MVEILFEDARLPGRKRILYPGCGAGELIDAVERYFDESLYNPPSGVAIDTDPENVETIREKYEDVDVRKSDFLSAEERLDSFDFILSYPPTVEWGQLTPEKQAEYANSSARVTPETTRIHTGLLFLEQSFHTLSEDGRGVFLTPTDFKTDDAAAPFRGYLAPKIADVEPVGFDLFDTEVAHMITVVDSPESEPVEAASSTVRPDPGEVEAQLMASAASPSTSDPAANIATSLPDLTVYGADDDASFVYLDLYYEDYDAALVYGDPDQLEDLRGYVSRADMSVGGQGTVSEHVLPLEDSVYLDPGTGLSSLIERLGRDNERFCFIGVDDAPQGVVTRFDLNKLPVYQYLYVELARFEIQLREIVREHVPDWETETDVSIFSSDVGDLAPDKLAGGSVGELLSILSEAGESSSVPCQLQDYGASLDDLRTLRNSVAHYKPIVHSMSNDAETGWTAGSLRERNKLFQAIIAG